MKSLDDVEEFWTKYSSSYDEEPDHGLRDPDVREAWVELLSAWLPAEPGIVADLGCGTGSLSLVAAELGARVVGFDLSPAMVSIAREKAVAAGHEIDVQVGDASAPPLAAESVDTVLCRHLLWTLPDPTAALDQWCELLRRDGQLLLIEGVWSTEDVPVDPDSPGLFPWRHGAPAAEVVGHLERLFGHVEYISTSDSPALWGGLIESERYLMVARKKRAI